MKATIDEWGELYEVATRIGELKPWERLCDLDIFGLQYDDDYEGTVFFNILGNAGECFGLAVYEGFSAFNSYFLPLQQEELGISQEYIISNRDCLLMYWGNRDELSKEQYDIVKELGYKYRGKNKWLYFMSCMPEYAPSNFDADEVELMTNYLLAFEKAYTYYIENDVNIDFEHGNMFLGTPSSFENGFWTYEERPLPFTNYGMPVFELEELKIAKRKGKISQIDVTLELAIVPTMSKMRSKEYDALISPSNCFIAEAENGMIISCEMSSPDCPALEKLFTEFMDFVFRNGVPKRIVVSNLILYYAFIEACKLWHIDCVIGETPVIDEAVESFSQMFGW